MPTILSDCHQWQSDNSLKGGIMSIVPERISLSIQRSIKVGDYQYSKIELGMTAETQDERPKEVIKRLYAYIDIQVNELLKAELAKINLDKQATADIFFKTK